MKKLSLFLTTILLITLLPVCVGAAGHNAMVGMAGSAFDESSVTLNKSGDVAESLSFKDGAYVLYRSVDFGNKGVYRADITISAHLDTPTYMGGILELRLDSQYGEGLATFQTNSTTHTMHSAELEEPITGVHDVYLVSLKSQPMRLVRVAFQEYAEGGNQFGAYNEPNYLKDIQDTGKKDLIYTLIELGLINPFLPDEYNPYIGIPRGMYAVTIARILGYDGGNGTSDFFDVDPTEEYAGAVAFLQSQGVIQGHGDGSYVPEVYITVNEALTMAVRALGYETVVAASGKGYPAGYVSMAASLGLTKGITMGDKLTRSDFATLVNNIINAEYLDTAGLYGDYEEGVQKTGILSKTKKLYVASGFIEANSATTLAAPVKSVGDGKVIIDGETYLVGDTYAAALIGYNVTFYYRDEDGEKTLVSVSPGKNVTVLTADTSAGDEVGTLTETRFAFYDADEDKQITENITTAAHILYNGKAIDAALASLLEPGVFRGRVRLIEAGDETTMVVEEYTTVWAESINSDSNKIYDGMSKQNIVYNPADNDVAVFLNGKSVLFSSILKNSVLTVYESKNKTGDGLIRMNVSTKSVEGTLTSVGAEHIYINEMPYLKSKQATQDFYPGLKGYFLLNDQGEVAAYSLSGGAADFRVGVLTAFKAGTGLDATLQLQIFEDTDAFGSYEGAEKMTIDGITVPGTSALNGNADFVGLNNMNILNTLVRYKTNEAGEISMLDTYLTGNSGAEDTFTRLTEPNTGYRFNGTSKLFVDGSDRAIAPYNANPALFGFKEADNANTLFYGANITAYRSASHAWNADKDTGELYTLDADKPYVNYVIWQNAGGASGYKPAFVVDKKLSTLIDGEQAIQISGYRNSAACSFWIKTEDYNSTLDPNMETVRKVLEHVQPGDILSFTASDDGEIFGVRLEFLANGAAANPAGVAAVCSTANGFGRLEAVSRLRAAIYGEVVDIFDNFVKIEYAPGQYEYVKATTCMRYSYRDGKPQVVNALSSEEISVGDKMFYVADNYSVTLLCIYDHPSLG